MDKALKKEISRDKQIIKFRLYGFLKDLKFFEPFLLIFLLGNGLSLLQIGILISIREIIINVFEIPSGFIADYFGRKKELCMCFIFYIVSFVFFFISKNFGLAVVAMIFFGLGEAFRSGTHKAMIYSYLEKKGWQKNKTYVYGKTRSSSLIGSAISSIIAILIIINVPNSGYIFIASIIPYLIDFVLILTYPQSLNCSAISQKRNVKDMFLLFKQSIIKNKNLRHILIGEGSFEAIITSIKDYVQPIMEMLIIGTGVVILSKVSPEDNLNIILGIIYACNNILGSIASKNSYRLKKWINGNTIINIMFCSLFALLFLLGLFINNPIAVFIIYLFIYLEQNERKLVCVD